MTSSKPSGTAKPPKPARRSTTSWTIPEPGDVLNYAYLWEYQAAQGQEEGLKERPAVVVLMRGGSDENPILTVCPVTSVQPETLEGFVEMPAKVKTHLGLTDRDHSYIVTTEINMFTWPGQDVRPFRHHGRIDICFGQIPQKLLYAVRDSMIVNIRSHKLKSTSRD